MLSRQPYIPHSSNNVSETPISLCAVVRSLEELYLQILSQSQFLGKFHPKKREMAKVTRSKVKGHPAPSDPLRKNKTDPKTTAPINKNTKGGRSSYARDDPQFLSLKQKLAITPKTTNMLLQLEYINDYRDLQHATPNQILTDLAKLPGMDVKTAEWYRRALRRMVWLGTQDEPEPMAKVCQYWSVVALKERGMWVDEYDDLTGKQVEERFGDALRTFVAKNS